MPNPVEFSNKDLLKCQMIEQDICPDTFDDRQLPTDVHIVKYQVGDILCYDAIRAYCKTDIFDIYYDKLKDVGQILNIKSGIGRIRPKLYGKIQQEDN